jgi:benzoate/toluate 1,2-dioxygenase subunit alpha
MEKKTLVASKMTGSPAGYIDDRPEDGIFRLNRAVYGDPALFEAEQDAIFGRCWNYICHESQLPAPGDYFSTTIGRHPVFAIRGDDGELRGFYDSCAHRGARLTRRRKGRARTLACRYHGWCFNAEGRCTLVRGGDEGYTKEARAALKTDLRPIAGLESYKGFVFGCLDEAAGSLEDFLGDVRPFIDLISDQSPHGMEVLRGDSTYMMKANWKLQTENSTDGYHVASVHRNFATTLGYREQLSGSDGMARTEASRILDLSNIQSGGYDLAGGHMINWSDRGSPEAGPLWESRNELLKRYPEGKVRWMVERGQTVTVFPNLLLNDVASTCIRVWRPLAPKLTEIDTWCLAPIGESPESRRARIRKYEDFFFPSSLAVPDDVTAMEFAHDGAQAGVGAGGGGWSEFALSRHTLVDGPDEAARELDVNVRFSNPGRESETPFYSFYREWLRRMEQP